MTMILSLVSAEHDDGGDCGNHCCHIRVASTDCEIAADTRDHLLVAAGNTFLNVFPTILAATNKLFNPTSSYYFCNFIMCNV